ncbi:retention module-containing protein [Halomonas sp. DP5N14-9]|uniref:retention module-containing protein n=1 Tax=Halomonas sp. DP5N14-9 TaxID=2859075 RepID=UPI001C99407A|nr:retention module-containing protein [Halomonas sp. DP5N14-9]MBY5942920.1 retention module-containing protein [Halomonas sp. DP5N14-9]
MPVTIATVSSFQGNAWVKRPNGDVIALEEGDRLDVGDIVITADGALVTLQFADGRPGVTLVDAQQVSLPEDMGQGDASSVEILDQQQVTELLRLLESEVPDLLEAIEAPGLGESGGGAEEGFDFVRLLRISESVDPQSYSFGGVGAVELLEPVESGGTPVADDEEVFLAEGEPDLPPVEEGEGSVSAGDNSVVEGSGQSVTGSVAVTAPAGVARVAVSGVDVSGASAASPVLIDGQHGTLAITGFDPDTGTIDYVYTEDGQPADHSAGDDSVFDRFEVVVTDNRGAQASDSLDINILDTVPLAEDDAARVGEDSSAPISGDLLDNDLARSDGLSFVGFDDTSARYGTFTDHGDGTWSYSVNTVNAAVQALDDGEHLMETFSYTVKDADGDISTATLTVLIDGSTDGDPNVVIQDSDGDVTAGDNSVVEGSGETVSGEMLLTASAGIGTATIAGSDITKATADNPVVIDTDQGKLEIVGFDNGAVDYRYTENSQGADHSAGDDSVVDRFEVVVTDTVGESRSDSLDINILDTEPEAVADTTSTAEDTAVSYNVLNNDDGTSDTQGADGASLTTATLRNPSQGSVSFTSDGSVTFTPAAGFEGQAVIDYTLTDGDGDTASSTLTVTVAADSTPTIDPSGPDGDPATADGAYSVLEAGLDGGTNQPAGSNAASNSESTSGQFQSSTGNDDLARYEVQNSDGDWVEINANGTTVAGDYGTLTVNTDGSWLYTLTDNVTHSGTNQTGLDDSLAETFGVRVVDSDGDTSAPADLTIAIGDDGPSAVADTTSTAEDTAVSYNVLNNSDDTSDTQGADGATLTTAALRNPSQGSVSFTSDGSVTFSPGGGLRR